MSENILNSFKWINEDFIIENVKKCVNVEKITLNSFCCKNALLKGENFGSFMIRITADYTCDNDITKNTVGFIIKTSFSSEQDKAFKEKVTTMDDEEITTIMDNLFNTEIDVYSIFIPKLEKLLAPCGKNVVLTPRCYSTNKKLRYLVLEDVSRIGYKNVNKRLGLDFQHLKITLSRIADWHASTAFLIAENPSVFNEYKAIFFQRDRPAIHEYGKNLLQTFSELSAEWPGFKDISTKLANIKNSGNRICDEYEFNPTDFYVLGHSDLWASNIMFLYDDQSKPVDAKLIDFSMVNRASAGRDISHLLFTSSNESVTENDWDELIKHYHSELCTVLKAINYPKRIPSLTDIQEQIIKSGLYNALVGVLVTGLRYTDLSKIDDHAVALFVSNNEGDAVKRKQFFKDPECIERIKFLLDYCNRKGFF